MPLTDRSKAKESGFAQVREALQKFKGLVATAEWGQWGGELRDEEGKPRPPREFLEVNCVDVEVLEVTEELAMSIEEWGFRVNCSDFKGSFWVDKFLESTDKFKLVPPDDLVGKAITWEKVTLEADDPKYNSTNYVIIAVEEGGAVASPKVVAKVAEPDAPQSMAEDAPSTGIDPMDVACEIAIGKTEAQFRTAVALDPQFVKSPLLSAAKAGTITQTLVTEGKLVVVEGVYQKPK